MSVIRAIQIALGQIATVHHDRRNAGMALLNADAHLVQNARDLHLSQHVQLKRMAGLQLVDLHLQAGEQVPNAIGIRRLKGAQNLQATVGTTRNQARGHGGLDTVHTARGRHDHALDVFDDIATQTHAQNGRLGTQRMAQNGGGIGNRDGLCASHRRNQFLLQYGGISS